MKNTLLLLSFLFLIGIKSVSAEDAPIVRGVLFYLPTCPHCHEVIENVLPPLQEQYGEQLQILLVNASYAQGQTLFNEACQTYAVPDCGGVPTLFIGNTYLIGSYDIPTQLPALIETGLENGGIAAPPFGELDPVFAEVFGAESTSLPEMTTILVEPTWTDRFEADPLGHSLALVVLVLLVLSLVIGAMVYQHTLILPQSYSNYALLGGTLLTLVIAGTLLIEMNDLSLTTLLASMLTLGLVGLLGMIWNRFSLAQILPLVIVLGVLVAAYLAYVEVNETEAVCGLVGDCNTVQQSDYAKLFGVLPIGILGLLGYAMIGFSWWFSQAYQNKGAEQLALGLTAGGAAFSIYLTYLELFVIKAVCAWCLTSAMLMLLLLWLQLPTPKLLKTR